MGYGGTESYELVAISLNGSQHRFRQRIMLGQTVTDKRCGTDRVLIDDRDLGRADFSAESRDNHLAALASWIAQEHVD